MGGVRRLLRHAFDELWIVDLGGEGRGALTEENVFDIRTPVAIAVGVRTGAERAAACVVRYRHVEGDRADKFALLRHMKQHPDHVASAGELGRSGGFEQVPGADLEAVRADQLARLPRLATGHRPIPVDQVWLQARSHMADRGIESCP